MLWWDHEAKKKETKRVDDSNSKGSHHYNYHYYDSNSTMPVFSLKIVKCLFCVFNDFLIEDQKRLFCLSLL